MITHDEMKKFCGMLDEEFKNDIRPILKCAQHSIDTLLHTIYNDEFNTKMARVGFDCLKFGHLPDSIQRVISNFGYFADSCNNYRIFHHSLSQSIISYLGYSPTCYGENGGVWDILCRADKFLGNDAQKVSFITELKKRFDKLRAAYQLFFIENDSEMFKRFVEIVLASRKRVEEADSKKDDEIYALFNCKPQTKNIKITVVIEGL